MWLFKLCGLYKTEKRKVEITEQYIFFMNTDINDMLVKILN